MPSACLLFASSQTARSVQDEWLTMSVLVAFILASVGIGLAANRAMAGGAFLKGFFLGNRGLGAWALALTATVQSGGTFMGFPSLVYSHGWVVALWIASYMVVPITGFGILGKRLAHLSRRFNAITVPDLFRNRFEAPWLGLVASLAIMFFMSFMLLAQFKAGAIVMKLSLPRTGSLALAEDAAVGLDQAYLIGLFVFSLTVVIYTLLGGFLAAVWTDLFQSVMMFVGVLVLFGLCMWNVGGMSAAGEGALANTAPEFIAAPGYHAAAHRPAPGVSPAESHAFLPLALAGTMFLQWAFGGVGSPAGMVRLMAGKNTTVIRRSIYLLSVYNMFIYLPIIMICMCGRVILPDLGSRSDELIPRLALLTTNGIPLGGLISGLILAAPFGAVMATASGLLVLLSSGMVRDVYQRFLRPNAESDELRLASYGAMIALGLLGVFTMMNPPQYLQALIVFTSSGAGCTFCVPVILMVYWRRSNAQGTLAGMLAGGGTVVLLYVLGFAGFDLWLRKARWLADGPAVGPVTSFRPFYLLDCDPVLWGLLASLLAGVVVTLRTPPASPGLVSKAFDKLPDRREFGRDAPIRHDAG
jgi:SSS family solute:Na+ symporter/sodium/pantothenate symporter